MADSKDYGMGRELTISEAIGFNDLLGMLDNAGAFDSNDPASTGLCREHAENTGTASDVHDNLVLEQMCVVVHGVSVGHSPHLILQHLLVDAKMGIGVEVVVLGGHFIAGNTLHAELVGVARVLVHTVGWEVFV